MMISLLLIYPSFISNEDTMIPINAITVFKLNV